jgi:hypothetical protein
MCDGECVLVGMAACALSASKPLCAGQCSPIPSSRPLECGAGDDVVRTERFPETSTRVDGAALVSPATVIIERESRR